LTTTPDRQAPAGAWYHDAVIYEVHVRAFADSDGDGIGDFRGLVSKLDYLRELGVTALWLLPFYPSPLRDDGYDISDYKSIHPAYGTMADFRRFMKEAHARDLKVITELVVNHTSDQHPWFQRARTAPSGTRERDFYVWSDDPERYKEARVIFQDTETSNWTWDPVAGAYYWHRFFSHQPDLNYESPDVRRAVFAAVDFWLDAGVDGLRLDAIPYLYEREGTMCENLPETHAFLKELRARIDAKYDGRMLLAEANQWPEDAVAYFGDGDECHMSFHFPLMPRLFMSLRMENRFPVIDILEQTPPIPESAAWAIFLRNHDELTLEMVTDEERDYMYRVYASDPQMRINMGIRRRLAPLLGNNRREIELLHAILLSLPGTPVLYYGDELGMGDNVYLGDRNGVRTPMQWSGDRNAGFSEANPQRLYFPVITDPEYHYETLNVEVQRANSNSLWWWVKRALALRRSMPELSRGTFEVLPNENPKTLTYLRALDGRSVLVVANLSRHPQPVEIDLSRFEGVQPVEVFGGSRFPVVGAGPYLLTIGPYDFYWLALATAEAAADHAALPAIPVKGELDDVFHAGADLVGALLADITGRRWFRSKAHIIAGGRLTALLDVPGTEAKVALLEVEYREADPETYVIPLSLATGPEADRVRRDVPRAVIAEVGDGASSGVLYDAAHDPTFATALVEVASGRRSVKRPGVALSADRVPGCRRLPSEIRELPVRVGTVEQSNTSIIFGDQLIMKLQRKVESGANPDVEVGRFLTDTARFGYVPALRGSIDLTSGGRKATFAMLHRFVPNEGDAWSRSTGLLTLSFEEMAARRQELSRPPSPIHPLDVGVEELEGARELIGVMLHEAGLLGQRTGEMHLALASASGDPAFAPQPVSTLYQRSLYQSVRSSIRANLGLLRRSRARLTPDQVELADRVLSHEEALLQGAKSITTEKVDMVRIRTHGDYHLGQVLFTGSDFVIIDFEGEPLRSMSERRIKQLALRDVAGMLRSYQYATSVALRTATDARGEQAGHDLPLSEWADAMTRWLSAAFLRGYLDAVGDSPIVPAQPHHLRWLLDALLVDKAAYELGYELNNRPDWVDIPLRGILGLAT
jgi:maltose alpha-D-glucosyltransferase/alpha-amylase